MPDDPIVDEVRRVREEHARRFEYDLDDIFADIKKQEQRSGHTFVVYAAKPAQTVLTSETADHEAPTR
jgi:hypothetical protein